MVSSKLFKSVNDGGFVDGSVTRFLSDFIIPSEQHVRVYSFVYNETTSPLPTSEDLVSVDLFDLVDNSVIFYEAPASTQSIVVEVATTPEEFGDVVAQGAVAAAEAARDAAIIAQNNAQSSATSASNDLLATNADVVSTNAAVVATNADVVSTNADATSTAGDKANIDTRLDTVQSNTLTVEQNIEALTTGQTAIDLANAEENAASASQSASEALASATSINPTNLLHTRDSGTGYPEGTSDVDYATATKGGVAKMHWDAVTGVFSITIDGTDIV